jgi:DNA repair exonuclease SbcCD ATPase subunit
MFKCITASNLFSWEQLYYEIKPGVSQITGFNYDDNTSEGSGKSSIPNILCWTLYGRIPKDAKIDEVVREGSRSGSGEVELLSGWKVFRSRNPNILKIVTPAGLNQCGKDAKETQQMINKLIGLDFEAFCQTVYFAQSYLNKFVSASETDKARILSEVQDLTIFDRARKKVQEEAKKEESALDEVEKLILVNKSALDKLKSNQNLLLEFIDKFHVERSAKIKSLESSVIDLEAKIASSAEILEKKEIPAIEAELEEIDEALESMAQERIAHESDLRIAKAAHVEGERLEKALKDGEGKAERLLIKKEKIESRIAKLEKDTSVPGNCPTCGQAASKKALLEHQKHLDEQIKDAHEELRSIEEDLQTIKEDRKQTQRRKKEIAESSSAENSQKVLEKLEADGKTLSQIRKQIQNEFLATKALEAEIRQAKDRLKSLRKEKDSVAASECTAEMKRVEALDTQIAEAKLKLKELKDADQEFRNRLNNLNILKNGFKEVKQYVFQSLLQELSLKATNIAADLFEVPIRIQFSNDSEDGGVSKIKTLVTLDGNERSLGLYSGGQYKRIELSVDLALASIVANRSQSPINIRIFDEPFQNLSEFSMEKVVALFARLPGSTILVEHNSIVKSIINETFHIEYRNKTSHAAETVSMPEMRSGA